MDQPRDLPCGVYRFESCDGLFRIVFDTPEFSFYTEAAPDCPASNIERYLDELVFPLGLELISEDEDMPEFTDDGWVRIYLRRVIPLDVELHDGHTLSSPELLASEVVADATASILASVSLLKTSPALIRKAVA